MKEEGKEVGSNIKEVRIILEAIAFGQLDVLGNYVASGHSSTRSGLPSMFGLRKEKRE